MQEVETIPITRNHLREIYAKLGDVFGGLHPYSEDYLETHFKTLAKDLSGMISLITGERMYPRMRTKEGREDLVEAFLGLVRGIESHRAYVIPDEDPETGKDNYDQACLACGNFVEEDGCILKKKERLRRKNIIHWQPYRELREKVDARIDWFQLGYKPEQ